jgi:DNA-binding MarR family transcriptional regulator
MVTTPLKVVNRPRTFVIIMCRAEKAMVEWLGSTFQTPGVRSASELMDGPFNYLPTQILAEESCERKQLSYDVGMRSSLGSGAAWLTPLEQRAWRAFMTVVGAVTTDLDAELEALHGLSLGEYGVLVRLSEAEDERLRMTDLACDLHLSPSGLTRRLDHLVRAGFVVREACPSDRRAVYAVLTAQGRAKLEAAAPDHVAGVRCHLIDLLDADELEQLATMLERVGARDAH